jgi:plastocyanin
MRRAAAIGACIAAAALAAPAAPAVALERVEASFFAEYAASLYEIDQGEVVIFANEDPFLAHGVVSDDEAAGEPLFEAPVISPGAGIRLMREAPFLTTGTYGFHCPIHPGMTSTLEVNASGTPLPADDTAPTAGLTVRRIAIARLLARRRLTLFVNPAEVAEVALAARAGGVALASAQRTYLSPGPRRLVLKLSRKAARALRARVARLTARGRRLLTLTVGASLVDVAGNAGASRGGRRLRLPAPPEPKKPKPKA